MKKTSFVVTRSVSAVSVLNQVRDDILKLEWEKISDNGHSTLVFKADVLTVLQEWIEYCLEEESV